ncbi:T9SS type A sorting domain-containing protein [bacterium]|nr:T9SS type A sorting domain-containing protein [bacterium]
MFLILGLLVVPSFAQHSAAQIVSHTPVDSLDPFICGIEVPDSVVWSSEENAYLPNPVPVTYWITNVSNETQSLKLLAMWFEEQDGLRLHPDSPSPVEIHMDLQIPPGDTARFAWLLQADSWGVPRTTGIQTLGVGGGGVLQPCSNSFSIGAADLPLSCALTLQDGLFCDQVLGTPSGDPFPATAVIRNTTATTIDSVYIKCSWFGEPMGSVIAIDPGSESGAVSYLGALEPGEEKAVNWTFIKLRELSANQRRDRFKINYALGDSAVESATLMRHTLTIDPIALKPEIQLQHTTLITDPYQELLWYRDGDSIPRATHYELRPIRPGWYKVRRTNPYGCFAFSDSIYVNFTSVEEPPPAAAMLNVFPNPAMQHCTVQLPETSHPTVLMLTDMLGRMQRKFDVRAGVQDLQLHVTDLPRGTYLLRLLGAERTWTRRLQLR